ncbi:hypothetical protein WOLCODRAFT_161037 [Wolfiporia cocos MD-104 SS10]|uniref:Uncharacterized protein n=1 Tax=Wolfiporia cocos (strain MD-104) TaxID=742152 RepID=A0A2H3JMA9_WOLCO|nr:hypothetical protein WOLCODRAFT_161037 [Wolfiporia cocos MD-104 SS10]
MEHLTGDWESLFDLLKRDSFRRFHQAIRASLQGALDLLEKEGFIHGDFRSSNIMVRIVGEEPEIKIIAYDWAGKASRVYYPAVRNESIGWPGEVNGLIQAGDDLKLLELWWPEKTPSWV